MNIIPALPLLSLDRLTRLSATSYQATQVIHDFLQWLARIVTTTNVVLGPRAIEDFIDLLNLSEEEFYVPLEDLFPDVDMGLYIR